MSAENVETEVKEEAVVQEQPAPVSPAPPVSQPIVVTARTLYQTCFVVSLVCSALSVFVYHSYFSVRLATLDLQGYMQGLREAATAGAMTEPQLIAAIDGAADVAKAAAGRYVIISSDVIIGDNRGIKRITLPPLPKVSAPAPALPQNGFPQ